MSLKLIELQVALPKSYDAGKIMEQNQQTSAIMQGNLQAENEKKLQKNRKTVTTKQKSNKLQNNKKEDNALTSEGVKDGKSIQEDGQLPDHPYKGIKIDFQG